MVPIEGRDREEERQSNNLQKYSLGEGEKKKIEAMKINLHNSERRGETVSQADRAQEQHRHAHTNIYTIYNLFSFGVERERDCNRMGTCSEGKRGSDFMKMS